uniref:Uncharacterized protein n=1 Tax=Corethron hystrix TaxID=216773 RepID=A0A7S1FZL9_9STRA|mmetsp:Transcript_42911/g.100736  ORF Transcript_42911/g.100736 Transcript_42911/m.100736 type:complete len:178 (+) Transcript_42911:153-686(+)
MSSFKSALSAVILASFASCFFTAAFQTTSSIDFARRDSEIVRYGYVPSGFTPESYKKFKEDEAKKKQKTGLGGVGPRGFKSRSMQSFQEAMERGEATHLMPVFNAKQKIARGEIKQEDVPYMQRGGKWDNSDIKGAKMKKWLKSDKDYSTGGYRKEQSVSILGTGKGLDWTVSSAFV